MIKPPNTYQPRKVLVSAILLSLFGLSSCGILDSSITEYHEFEVINESSDYILIKSFEKTRIIDSIPIKSQESYSKLIDQKRFINHNTIFSTNDVDSVIILNQQGKSIILTCGSQPLLHAFVTCPELENSIATMHLYGNDVSKQVQGKLVTWYSFVSYKDSDFQ